MLDPSFLQEHMRMIGKDNYLLISKSGMRKLVIRHFIQDEDVPPFLLRPWGFLRVKEDLVPSTLQSGLNS
jgi:hypothetical protein